MELLFPRRKLKSSSPSEVPDPVRLANTLPDLPRYVEARWLLLSGRCRVLVDQTSPEAFAVIGGCVPLGAVMGKPGPSVMAEIRRLRPPFEIVVQSSDLEYLRLALPGWKSVNAVIHTREGSPPHPPPPAEVKVHVSFPPEPSILQQLPEDVHIWARASEGMAVALENGQPVSICHATAVTQKWWDAGVGTDPAFRRQGLAQACFRAMDERMTATGREPVWGADTNNTASLRLAAKLGFRAVDHLSVLAPL